MNSTGKSNSWENLSHRLKTLSTRREDRIEQLEQKSSWVEALTLTIADYDRALEITNALIQDCQDKAASIADNIIPLFVTSVFGPSYGFRFDKRIDRGRPAFTPVVIDNGRDRSVHSVGCGLKDVLSLACRVTAWTLSAKSTDCILFDEPGKFVSKDLLQSFGETIKYISEELGIQIVLISHDDALIEIADKSFLIEHDDGGSHLATTETK